MLKHQGDNFQGREQCFYDKGFLTSLLKEAERFAVAFKVAGCFLTSGFKQPGSRRAGMWIREEGFV